MSTNHSSSSSEPYYLEMNKSLLLSGEQLLDLKCSLQDKKKMRGRRNRNQMGFRSAKFTRLSSSFNMSVVEEEVDLELRRRYIDILGSGRVRLSHDMGIVEWCPESKSGKVISAKKRPSWMGFAGTNNQLMYTPEEIIFLMEAECILVNYLSAQLSLQSAYQLILADNQLAKYYQVYAYLSRFGYKLKSFLCENISVIRSLSSQERKTIIDVVNSKINSLRLKSSDKSIRNNLNLVTMPLRRGMFLNGTCFEKLATWSEYKRVKYPRENGQNILEEEGIVLELTDEICSSENIFDQLPNSSLVDSKTDLKPLIDQTKPIDMKKFHQILKTTGPGERYLHQLLPPSKPPPEMSYQVFKPTVKSFSSAKPDYRMVICGHRYPPMPQEVMTISETNGQLKSIYSFTISHSEPSLRTIEPIDLWDEYPTFWDSSIRRR